MSHDFLFQPMQKRHEVITLVGSTAPEWREKYRLVARELTLAGFVVISVGIFKGDIADMEKYRDTLESVHFQKIDMADKVVLIDREAIGKHRGIEIQYAKRNGKPMLVFDGSARTLAPLS